MRQLFVIAAAAVIGMLGLAIAIQDRQKSERFDAAEWRAAGGRCSGTRREAMANDLVHHVLRHGMTPEQVRALLGPPYAQVERPGIRGEWWSTGWNGHDCAGIVSVWYRNGRLTETQR